MVTSKMLGAFRTDQATRQEFLSLIGGIAGGWNERFNQRESWMAERSPVEFVEEGAFLAPRLDRAGLIPVVTTDALSGEVLMLGVMNAEALLRTIETREAHYWSRSCGVLW